MRRRFLSSSPGTNEVPLSIKGVSVLLVKTDIQSFNDKVLRIKGDEVRLPKDLFTGESVSGTVQVFEKRSTTSTSQPNKIQKK